MDDVESIFLNSVRIISQMSTISSPKFGTSIVSTAYGAYLDHAYAQNLAKPPCMRICRNFENWRDLRTLSGKFLRQKSYYPESFRFLWLCSMIYPYDKLDVDL